MPSWRVWNLSGLLAVTAATLFAMQIDPFGSVGAPLSIPWPVLAAMFCVAEIFAVHVHVGRDAHSFAITELPIVLGLFFATPAALIGGMLAGTIPALVLHRKQRPMKIAFNLAQWGLGICVAVVVFHAVLGDGARLGPMGWTAAFAATLTIDVVSALAITIALSMLEGRLRLQDLRGLPGLGTVATLTNTGLALLAVTVLWRDLRAAWLLAIAGGVLALTYRAYTTIRQRYGSLELLYDSTRIVEKPLEDAAVLPEILRQLCTMFRADVAEVDLFEGEGTAARLSLRNEELHSEQIHLDPTDGVWARVCSEGAPVLLAKPIRSERLRAHLESRGIHDAMVTPLHLGASIVGSLMVANRADDVSTFDEEDLRLFETFANHASVMVHNGKLVERLRREASEKQHQALHDALTGLPNRALLRDRVEHAIATAKRDAGRVAVMMLDLDRFKEVNDTLGHHNGDLLLQAVAGRLCETLREGDTVARLGGDEFALVMPVAEARDATLAAEKLLAALRPQLVLQEVTITIGASIGIALFPDNGDDADLLLQRADVAMYLAKEHQTGSEVYSSERDRYSATRLAMVGELRKAIETDELVVFYQPKADLRTGRITSVEALVRWAHPRQGFVSPDEFITLAEQTGLIRGLTFTVLDSTLAQCRRWADAGHDITVAVNLSARMLLDEKLPDEIAERLRMHAVEPSRLTLEITETSIMADPARTAAILSRLSAMGVGISIDDFGTGYSSLSHLKRLPVDEIKIDRSFVMNMVSDEDDAVIVRSIVELGRTLGLRVVAEGVETEAIWNQLQTLGCHVAQGYLVSRPVPAEKLTQLLRIAGEQRDVVRAPRLSIAEIA